MQILKFKVTPKMLRESVLGMFTELLGISLFLLFLYGLTVIFLYLSK